jgi:Xaa-Pro aminopeptidase
MRSQGRHPTGRGAPGEPAAVVLTGARPGDPWSKVQEVADRHIDEAGIRKWVWWVGGYAPSQSVPPDWVGTHFVDPHDGIADRPLLTGMVFNLENQFDVWEGWPGGTGAAYIESFLVTDGGLEILSKLPRNLTEL